MNRSLLAMSLFLSCAVSSAMAQIPVDKVEVYPRASAARKSGKFLVEVQVPNLATTPPSLQWVDAEAYQYGRRSVDWQYSPKQIPYVHWATIGIEHSARVRVTDVNPTSATTAFNFQPSRYATRVVTSGNEAEFTIERGQNLAIVTDNQVVDTLFVFANPPAEQAPALSDPDTLHFLAGESFIGFRRIAPNIRTVYFHPGSWVIGTLNLTDALAVGTVKIRGPGVLSGEFEDWENVRYLPFSATRPYMLIHTDQAPPGPLNNPVLIDGPTLVASPFYNLELGAVRGLKTIRNVHILSPWTYNTDAFNVGTHAEIRNCFAFNNDDTIPGEYAKTAAPTDSLALEVSECVFGGRNSFLIGYGYFNNVATGHARITNCDILMQRLRLASNDYGYIPFRAQVDAAPTGVIVENQIYKDIRIDGSVERLFDLRLDQTQWGWNDPAFPDVNGEDPPNAPIYGNIRAILFENIELTGTQWTKSEIHGYNSANNVTNVEFRNLVINGTRVTSANYLTFFNVGPTVQVRFQ